MKTGAKSGEWVSIDISGNVRRVSRKNMKVVNGVMGFDMGWKHEHKTQKNGKKVGYLQEVVISSQKMGNSFYVNFSAKVKCAGASINYQS